MATNVQDIKKELDEYISNNKSVISAGVYAGEVTLDKYCKKITSVKGKFPQFHRILTRVIQGYSPVWQALGDMELKSKILKNYRQKVNFPILVDDIYASWLSELKIEGKTPEEQPLAKMIIAELIEKIQDDAQDLSVSAVYNLANADGQYGESLDGIEEVINKIVADATHPAFKIPLNAITSVNILDELGKSFVKQLPSKIRKKIKRIFVSEDLGITYEEVYADTYQVNPNFKDGDTMKTVLKKKEIVGLPGMSDTVIFATVEGNMVKLIDVIDNPPAITDTQVADYLLKIFMEFHLGYDFLINELVFVGSFDASPRGLGDNALNALYYPSENIPVV